jgi:hypothetical protein
MGSLSSPLMIPGAVNPSGTTLSMPAPFSGVLPSGSAGGKGVNTLLPGGTNPSQHNPYVPATSTGGFGAYGFPPGSSSTTGTPGSGSSSSTIPGINVGNISDLSSGDMGSLLNKLDKTYGKGMGDLLAKFLSSGAGYNPQVLQQMFAQLQPGFANQQQNLLQQFSASGNRFGSGAETGYADLLGQQSLTEGNIAAQLYEQSVQNYMQILEGVSNMDATRIMNTPSALDNTAMMLNALKPNVTVA